MARPAKAETAGLTIGGGDLTRPICLLICACFLFVPESPGQTTKHRASAAIDQDYVRALSAANQFLFAWETRNQYDGLALLSSKLKNKYPEEYLRSYISGVENPHHQAFEIGRGKRLAAGRFSFPVVLYEHYTGQKETVAHPQALTIVLTQAGSENWLVDELPGFVSAGSKEE